jgi:multiple sugar transport system permease protein
MTDGGPNYSTLFYLLYLFRAAFENFRMGYASAMAWVLFIIVLIFTILQFMLSDRWVFYEGDLRR